MKIVANMSVPAVDRPNAACWNAARSCQKYALANFPYDFSQNYWQVQLKPKLKQGWVGFITQPPPTSAVANLVTIVKHIRHHYHKLATQ